VSAPRTRAGIALGLIALTLAVFAQLRSHEFVDWDDMVHIVTNPQVTSGLGWEPLREAFLHPLQEQWWPLTRVSQQLDQELWNLEPGPVLLTNAALHALSSVLLFLALATMTGATWRSAFVAAVFAVHPLHVESVAWASERKDALSGVFFMLTLAAYARYAARPFSTVRYAGVLLALTLGLLSKPTLVTLPCVLLLLDHWPLGRLGRTSVLEKLPMLIPVAAVCAITVGVQIQAGAMDFGDTIPLDQRILNAIESWLVYVVMSFWPSDLTVFYPHPRDLLSPAIVAAEGIAVAALSVAVVALRRSRPYLLVGWLWYLGTLVPVIGLIQVGMQARADRYMYLPLIGLSIMVAWGTHDLVRGRHSRRVLAAAAIASVAALASAAWVQTGTWKNTRTLFERNVALHPDSYEGHHSLATLHLRAGRLEEAESHYAAMYRILPDGGRGSLVLFHIGMGRRLSRQGDTEAAIARFEQALHLDPDGFEALARLGRLLVSVGRHSEAIPHLERALGAAPESAPLHASLATAAEALGRNALAVDHYREVVRLTPNNSIAANNLAWLLATAPDPTDADAAEAVRFAESSVQATNHTDPSRLDTLAAAYAAAGRFDDAVETADRAAALARDGGNTDLEAEIRGHLAHYRTQQPYRLDSSASGAR